MVNAKREVIELLDRLPDDVTFEEIQYHLYVRQKVEAGLAAADEGHVLTQEEVERRMEQWLGGGG